MDPLKLTGLAVMTTFCFLTDTSRKDPDKAFKIWVGMTFLTVVFVFLVPEWQDIWFFLIGPVLFLTTMYKSSILTKAAAGLLAIGGLVVSFLAGFCLIRLFSVLVPAGDELLQWMLAGTMLVVSLCLIPLEKLLLKNLAGSMDESHMAWLLLPFLLCVLLGWIVFVNANEGGIAWLIYFPAVILTWGSLIVYASKTAKDKAALKEQAMQEKMERLSSNYGLECRYLHGQLQQQARLYQLAEKGDTRGILNELEKSADQKKELFYLLSCPSKVLGAVLFTRQKMLQKNNLSVSLQIIDSDVYELSDLELAQLYETMLDPVFASQATVLVLRQIREEAGVLIDLSVNAQCSWNIESKANIRFRQTSSLKDSHLRIRILLPESAYHKQAGFLKPVQARIRRGWKTLKAERTNPPARS